MKYNSFFYRWFYIFCKEICAPTIFVPSQILRTLFARALANPIMPAQKCRHAYPKKNSGYTCPLKFSDTQEQLLKMHECILANFRMPERTRIQKS